MNFLKVKRIRNAILFTLGMMVVYCIGRNLIIPGVNVLGIEGVSALTIFSMFTGGSFETFSLFSLGIGPSITASIIVELLSLDIIPYFTELKEDGNRGRKKLAKITQIIGFVLAIIQSYSMVRLFDIQYSVLADNSVTSYIYTIILMTAGSLLLYWMGNLITEYGVGNGVSTIILFGILTGIPSTLRSSYTALSTFTENNVLNYVLFAIYIIVLLAIIYIITLMSTGVRKINISFGRKLANGQKFTYLPIKVNTTSVMPLIFANALMTSPLIIISYINRDLYLKLSEMFAIGQPLGTFVLALFMFLMGLFYVNVVVLNPDEILKNITKNGGFIPGVKTGKPMKEYLSRVINQTTLVGIIGLILLIIIPYALVWIFKLPTSISFGGTSLILIVSIVADIISTMEANVKSSKYKEWF